MDRRARGRSRSVAVELSIICGVIAALIGLAGMASWLFDMPELRRLLPAPTFMKPNTALGVLGCGVALVLRGRGHERSVTVIALAVMALSVATLIEHVTGTALGIDNLLVPQEMIAKDPTVGRFSIATAAALTLAALALLCGSIPSLVAQLIVQLACMSGLAIALFAVAVYLLDHEGLTRLPAFRVISPQAAIAHAVVFTGIGLASVAQSLRWYLGLIMVVIITPIAALMVHFAGAERTAAVESAHQRLRDLAINAAQRQDGIIASTRALLETLAGMPEMRQPGAACTDVLARFVKLNSWMTALFVAPASGLPDCGTPATTLTLNVADRPYFRAAVAGGGFAVTDVIASRITGDPRVIAALPIKEDGRVVRVLVGVIDAEAFGRVLAEVSAAWRVTVALIDSRGAVIARHPLPAGMTSISGRSVADETFAQHALESSDSLYEARDIDGRVSLFAAHGLMLSDAVVVVGYDKTAVVGPIDQLLAQRLALIGALLVFSVAFAFVGSEFLVFKPLRALNQAASRMTAGDLEARPTQRAQGEIEALRQALLHMTDAVGDRERRLAAAEQLFHGVFDSSPDLLFVHRVTENGFVMETWNEAAARAIGATPNVSGGAPLARLLAPALAARVEGQLAATLASRTPHRFEDERSFGAEDAAWEVIHVPLEDESGHVNRILASVRDITERKRIERIKNEFVSTVSHELRTPLTSIVGSLGLLVGGRVGPLPERALRLVTIAQQNCLRLVRLINDILDIEKIESGRMPFNIRPVSLYEAAAEAAADLKGFADSYGATIRLPPRDGELTVKADPDRLAQVITNLLSNAVKFSPRGETVDIELADLGGLARLSIRDRGPGIPESFRAQMFTKFAQADASDSRAKGGTGLGLAIVKEIVDRLGGWVNYETAPGQGTVFHVVLPLASTGEVAAREVTASR